MVQIFSLRTGSKGLQQVSWCPTRSGILASVSRDENCVKLWDIKDNTAVMLGSSFDMHEGEGSRGHRRSDSSEVPASSGGLAGVGSSEHDLVREAMRSDSKSLLLADADGMDSELKSRSNSALKAGGELSIALNKPVKGTHSSSRSCARCQTIV